MRDDVIVPGRSERGRGLHSGRSRRMHRCPKMGQQRSRQLVRPLVLVVEDEASLRALLSELLEEAGYAVRVAENGMAALAVLERERPRVVLTDYTMPGLDGPGLIERLRAHPATCHIPVIAMSATRPTQHALGGVPFIEKPFDVDDILDAIALHTAGSPFEDDPLWAET